MKTVLLLIAFVFASIHIADAQQTKKVPRIGYLATKALFTESFLEALRDLGYFEGENIAFEFRTTDGRAERYS